GSCCPPGVKGRWPMFVITGATGHTGRVVAQTLLDRKQKVRLVVRDAARAAQWKERGAEIAVSTLENPETLAQAFSGADGVYAMVPPNTTSNNVLADQKRVVESIARALETARPRHVVMLSSIGAELESGN